MYVFVLLLTLVVSTYQQVQDPAYLEKWNSVKADCAKEHKLDLAVIRKAWTDNHFPNDQSFKCYYQCVQTKMGVLDATGEVVDDKLKEMMNQVTDIPTRDEIVEECGPLKGADLCETAYKLIACMKAATID